VVAVLFAWLVTQLLIAPGFHPDLPWQRIPPQRLPVALAFPSMAFGLLPVGWSLYVELAMSAVFPLLLMLGRRVHPLVPVLVSIAFLAELPRAWTFLRFSLDFAVGLALRLESDRIGAWIGRLPASVPAVLGVVGLALLQLPYYAGLAATGYAGLEHGHSSSVVVQFSAAAALLLVAALHSPTLRGAFASAPGRFFGRISYSLYLVHLTVILVFVTLDADQKFSWPAGLAVGSVSFAISVALSELGWRCVEEPAIRAGRAVIRAGESLARRIAASVAS
jgi:peptidoglycan/LPS O-acetylase OafA/YrhL